MPSQGTALFNAQFNMCKVGKGEETIGCGKRCEVFPSSSVSTKQTSTFDLPEVELLPKSTGWCVPVNDMSEISPYWQVNKLARYHFLVGDRLWDQRPLLLVELEA